MQATRAKALGCNALAVAPGCTDGIDGVIGGRVLTDLGNLDAVVSWTDCLDEHRKALAERDGAIVPILCNQDFEQWLMLERHACIDTTAAGGNVALLGG